MEDRNEVSDAGRRALIIAYYWPPAGGPGVQRWLKFAKYLPDCGWTPALLVPEGAAYPVEDPSLLEDVPDALDVWRVPIFEPYEAALGLFQKKGAERLGSGGKQKSGPMDRIMRWIRGNVLLPDPRVLWRKPATRQALKLIQRSIREQRPIDVIITTGPPHSVHLIGSDLKKKTGLPWIADFRDPWREMDYLEDFLPTNRTRRRHLQMEGQVLAHCDMALMTSKGIRTSFSVHPEAEKKLQLIPNGWDESDLPENEKTAPWSIPDQWNIGHFGSAFPIRNAPGLWRAIAHWNEREPRKIHLHFHGVVNPTVKEALDAALPEQWTDHGYAPHKEAVAAMQRMDTLLILQNRSESGRHAIPGKAFEYLALGRPLLVVTPRPSDLADLTLEWGGHVIGYDDETEALSTLTQLERSPGPDAASRMAFNRRNQAADLAVRMDSLVNR